MGEIMKGAVRIELTALAVVIIKGVGGRHKIQTPLCPPPSVVNCKYLSFEVK